MNRNPTMKNASKNLTQILNPKPTIQEKHAEIEKQVIQEVFGT